MQLWARAFPSLKVNTVKMPAPHDETSERAIKNVTPYPECLTPSLSHHCFFLFCSLVFTQAHTHTHTLCLTRSLSFLWLCWRDNSIYREDRLRQARLATYTEAWIYVSHREECTWHCSGTLWHKRVKLSKSCWMGVGSGKGCFLASFASLRSLTFVGPALLRCLRGAINGRKCPWRGYKRTAAPRWEDDGDLRQRRVTER